ncbi:MAG: long-chain-fatty-acid--CoA ligase [Deltaproteobacteria bacterium]|nr:long-chain-fatty-acid--CoA ligase [Deltaproteobacteria bacterium]
MVLGDILRVNAHRFRGRIAHRDERRALTFEQVNRRANALIRALMDMGLKKGDHIAVLLYNCVEYEELLFALPKAGFIIVTLNYRLIGRELEYILSDSEACALIYDAALDATVEDIRPHLELVKHYIVVDRSGGSKAEALDYEKLIQSSSDAEISVPVTESDTAFILYTSGTTGLPKGAMLTHKNLMTNLFSTMFELQIGSDDKIFNVPPLYHCAGQNMSMAYFFYGCEIVTIKQFDPEPLLETIKAERPNILHLVPAMQNMIINHPDIGGYDFSFVDLMLYGASSIMKSQLKQSIDVFGCKFMQCAGQTEASPVLTMLRPEDHVIDGPEHMVRRLGSAGKEVKLTEVKIVDPEGNELPPNVPGEEIARGDNVMKGYWKLPEATAETVVDGWLHTGDICLKDEHGFIYYKDRIKDMICRGGENIYPREVEEVIASHPSVREVAVIGIPDERLQEEIMAVIAPVKGEMPSEKDIIRLCEENLARFKKPRHMAFVDELPKNASGKILKRELKKAYGSSSIHQKK